MEIRNYLSLKTCQRLKEAGFPQDLTFLVWDGQSKTEDDWKMSIKYQYVTERKGAEQDLYGQIDWINELLACPNSDELMAEIEKILDNKIDYSFVSAFGETIGVGFVFEKDIHITFNFSAKRLNEALAELYIFLKAQ